MYTSCFYVGSAWLLLLPNSVFFMFLFTVDVAEIKYPSKQKQRLLRVLGIATGCDF